MITGAPICVDLDRIAGEFPALSAEELSRLLGTPPANLQTALERLATAALAEVLQMVAVQPMSRNAGELRQQRLFFLARYFIGDESPREADIARLFRIRRTEARRLIDDTRLRFGPALDKPFFRSVVAAITKNKPSKRTGRDAIPFESVDGGVYRAVLEHSVERFPTRSQPWKADNAGAVYFIPAETYWDILEYFTKLAG